MKRAVLLIVVCLSLTAVVSGQDITIAGLEEQPINQTIEDTSVRFTTDYLNKSVGFLDVVVPETYRDDIKNSKVQNKDNSEFQIQVEFEQNDSLPSYVSGRKIDGKVKITGKETKGELLNGTYYDSGDNLILTVTAEAHYEHLVLNYDLYNETDDETVQEQPQDVYSGPEPDLFPIRNQELSKTGFEDPITQRIMIEPDNRFDDKKNVTAIFAFENDESLVDVQFNYYQELENPEQWYLEYVDRAQNTNDTATLLNDSSNYTFKAYNVTIPADSSPELKIETTTQTASTERAGSYILGSHGSFTAEGDSHVYEFNGSSEAESKYTEDLPAGTYRAVIHGADGGDGSGSFQGVGGTGGYINGTFNVSDADNVNIWVGEAGTTNGDGGWGRNNGGGAGPSSQYENQQGGGGGGSTEILVNSTFLAAADAGGGGGACEEDYPEGSAGGGGARGGSGGAGENNNDGENAEGSGYGGDGGDGLDAYGCKAQDGGDGGAGAANDFDVDKNITGGATEDSNGHGYVELTYVEPANKDPVVQSQAYNTSQPQYGDTLALLGNITDPDGSIPQVNMTVWEGSSKIIDNQQASQLASGNWSSPSFQIDEINVWYNASVTYAVDDAGATTTATQNVSIYIDNPPPAITDTNLTINYATDTSTLLFGLDDLGQSDIDSWTGSGTVQQFTNTTLVTGVQLPVDRTYTVTDFFAASTSQTVNVSNSTTQLQQHAPFDHDITTQRTNKSATLTSNGTGLNYNLSLASYGTTVQGDIWTGTLATDSSVTHTGIWENDYIPHQAYDLAPTIDEVTLGFNYTASLPLYLDNTQSIDWTDIATGPGLTPPNRCSQTNNTAVDISAGFDQNISVEFTCNTGTPGTGQQTIVDKGDNDRVWFNITDIELYSNATEETRIVRRISDSDLLNWDTRNAKSEEAWANGRDKNISIVDTEDYVYIKVGTNHGNSSLHEGSHTMALTYTYNTESPSGGSGGGGGGSGGTGGGGSSDEEETESVEYDVTFGVNDIYTAPPDASTTQTLRINNLIAQENTVEVHALTDQFPGCEYIDIQRTLNSNQFANSAVYTLPSRTRGLDKAAYSEQIRIKTTLPPVNELALSGENGTVQCGFRVNATRGTAADLLIRVRPEKGFIAQLNSFFETSIGGKLAQFKTVCTSLSVLDTNQKTCPADSESTIPWPTATGILVMVILVVLIVAARRIVPGDTTG